MVETGYKPEFALGALYAGENAANSQAMGQEELIKAFLANQRERQSQPLDMDILGLKAARDRAMNTPEDIDQYRRGYNGQMKSQEVAGDTAQILAPFRRNTEQLQLENDANKQNVLRTVMDIDSKLNQGGSLDEQGNLVPFTEQDKSVLGKLRQKHIEQLASTPEFYQKQSLQSDRLDSAENIALLKMQNAIKIQELKAQIKNDPKTAEAVMASLLAKMNRGESLTPSEHEVYQLASSVVERKAPEVKPGTSLDVTNPKLKNAPLKENPPRETIKQPSGSTSLESTVKASGIPYEPNLYDYRVVDGKVQRKKKD